MKSNILIIGGTGKTGRKVVEGLKKYDVSIHIGSRNSKPVFDWGTPTTWPQALEGIDKVYIVYYPDLAVPGARATITKFVDAAKKSGVKKAVLLSGKGEKEAELCEQVVADSGLQYTLVRASWFNQNFSESFLLDPILAGHVALPMPEARIPFVDTDDIAEVVVESLMNDEHNGKTYEITGPELLTFKEAINEISIGIDRKIHFETVTLEEYNTMMKAAGLPDDYIWLFDYLFREVLGNQDNQVVANDYENIIGKKATSFAEYVQKTVSSGIWHENIPQSI